MINTVLYIGIIRSLLGFSLRDLLKVPFYIRKIVVESITEVKFQYTFRILFEFCIKFSI